MPQGGTLSVATKFNQEMDRIEIQVTDTGLGISEDDMERIFEPFFTTKADGKGVGLGLSVAYGIIRQHQGEIHIQSAVDEGTQFTIQLPPGLSTLSLEDQKENEFVFTTAAHTK
jgi:two-component system NtrC family sensor kinase